MKFIELFCCVILTVTVTASCVQTQEQTTHIEETQAERRLVKRDAAVLMDSYPIEPMYLRPKVIYQRISKHRYAPPAKARYVPPRPKYGMAKVGRIPGKKYRGKKPYGPSGYKKRSPKPKPNLNFPKQQKPVFGPFNKVHRYSYHAPKPTPASFGEPPQDQDYQLVKPKFVIPPVDSYGDTVKSTINDQLLTTNNFPETTVQYDTADTSGFDHELWQNFNKDKAADNEYLMSKKLPLFLKTESDLQVTPAPDFGDDNLSSYSDIYAYRQNMKDIKLRTNNKKKRTQYNPELNINRPWKAQKRPVKAEIDDDEEEVLVGGQYAEPPPRYITKYQPGLAVFSRNNDFHAPRVYRDMRVMTGRRSPYVNYKNSNMAFSPQNLNDAFSINK